MCVLIDMQRSSREYDLTQLMFSVIILLAAVDVIRVSVDQDDAGS